MVRNKDGGKQQRERGRKRETNVLIIPFKGTRSVT